MTVSRWFHSRHTLKTKPRPSRPSLLTPRQIREFILTPIRSSNRDSTTVHYTTLLPTVRAKTRTNISLRSLQRIGHDDCFSLVPLTPHTQNETATQSTVAAHSAPNS